MKVNRIRSLIFILGSILIMGGCGLMQETNFETEEEAQVKCQELLKEKYGIDFEITDGELGTDRNDFGDEYTYYHATITDPNGLAAKAGLLAKAQKRKLYMNLGTNYLNLHQDANGLQDTYSEVYYTKLTRPTIENLLKDEKDIKAYYISLDNPHYARSDLSLTADEYMDEAETIYWISVILEDDKTFEEYADIVNSLMNRLINEQKYGFFLTVYANDEEIFSQTYYTSENFSYNKTYDDVLEAIEVRANANLTIPEEQYLLDDFYNGEN